MRSRVLKPRGYAATMLPKPQLRCCSKTPSDNFFTSDTAHNAEMVVFCTHGNDESSGGTIIAESNRARDEFELLSLISKNCHNKNENIRLRLKLLRSLQTDIERYVFLRALQYSNAALFKDLLERDIKDASCREYVKRDGLIRHVLPRLLTVNRLRDRARYVR
jgi:hypothetical protein